MNFIILKSFFLKKKIWTIFKVFIEFVTILFMFWFFGHEAYGILAPRLGIASHPLKWKVTS